MITVSIIGYGNVGYHLAHAFHQADGVLLDQVITTRKDHIDDVLFLSDITTILPGSDVYLLCVPDDYVASISEQLQYYLPPTSFICHVSGTGEMDLIHTYFKRRGIFYPLQTFTRGIDMMYTDIPFILSAAPVRSIKTLQDLVTSLGAQHYEITAQQKKVLHVAAVFVNNFSNAMLDIADELVEKHDISDALLRPLALQTVEKLKTLSPREAQTGPAVRKDAGTIQKHLEFLADDPDLQTIYDLITQYIQKRNA